MLQGHLHEIIIAGGTGFLGSPLAEMYAEEGNEVRVLTRSLASGETRHDPGTGVPGITRVGWNPDGGSGPWASVARGRRRRHQPLGRVAGREALVGAARNEFRQPHPGHAQPRDRDPAARRSPPAVLISGSAVGYYGASDDRPLTERDGPGIDFLAQLCVDWEQEAQQAERPGTRVVLLRTGMVLERSGGALPEMMRPFKFFVGGPIGSGTAVRLVDPSARLDRDRPLDRANAGCQRPGERDGAASRSRTATSRARSATPCIAPA